MTTNPYFDFFGGPEADLAEDLLIEAIQIYGFNMIYIPRQSVKLDLLYGEDILSQFTDRYEMEMYIQTIEGFQTPGEFLSKFGIEIQNQADFVVAKKVFDQEIAGVLERPREGDLIWCSIINKLFKIVFVEHEIPFYQLGHLNRYVLTIEQFQFSHETIETGLPEIDTIEQTYSYQIYLTTNTGEGTYQEDETIYQGESLAEATARAKVVSYANSVITAINVIGEFEADETVTGTISGAVWTLSAASTGEYREDPTVDNKRIEDEADEILDFTEDNPFGDP